jgi:hypothetical protein
MTGRERFDAVIDGKRPDRLPIYFTAVACSVASEILGREVHTGADSLHFKEELALFLGSQAHVEFEEKHLEDVCELWRTLGVDVVREVWRRQMKPSRRIDEHTLLFGDENNEHIVKRYCPETQTYGIVHNTVRQMEPEKLAARLEKNLADTPELPCRPNAINESTEQLFLRMGAGYGQMVPGGGIDFSFYDPLWLELLVSEPELIKRWLMRHARRECRLVRQAAAQGFRWISGGGDLAGATGPIISPAVFRDVFVDPIKLVADTCAELGLIYCYRSDGNLWPIFDDLAGTAGIQAYGEVDRAATMTVGEVLKRSKKLIVLGNTSSALLAKGTEQQVRDDTRQQLEEAGGRRFIPGPSNAVVHGTPVRNLFAMLEELKK